MTDAREVRAGVVIVGAGAAGMYAALAAQAGGADVLLLDKSRIGRGGATVMAQMTVAAAMGHAEPDTPEEHVADTLAAGRELNERSLVELICHDGPRRILETRDMGVDWASDGDRLVQVSAPGHSRRRCCYVDVLSTGPSVSRAMRVEIRRRGIRTETNLVVADVILDADGAVAGLTAVDLVSGEQVSIWTRAVVLATGGITELFARNSASVNMTGDGYALALRAGAQLADAEMVQFFPIANLAPRTVGLDPIMWDPFRYKLGGRLLNGIGEEFVHRYDAVGDEGSYRATRDVVSYAILKEVEAGRGSPHGGAYLDFTDLPGERIRDAFPPVVDKLLAQGIDLTRQAVEVAPMAHYTIGGVRVDTEMATGVPGLWAAGELVGGAHGGNRLSGNAITEAFVFGALAGESAARSTAGESAGSTGVDATASRRMSACHERYAALRGRQGDGDTTPRLRRRLKTVMWEHVGPFRTEAGLAQAAREIDELAASHAAAPVGDAQAYNLELTEWIELSQMLDVARAVCTGARLRTESRGAHQRLDHPETDPAQTAHLVQWRDDDGWQHAWTPVGNLSSPAVAAPDSTAVVER